MTGGFCDNCGEGFPKATSNFCSGCGCRRASEIVEVVEANASVEQETTVQLWAVPEYKGTNTITLYDRVYGVKPQGVGEDVLWGKRFLKSHREYRRQHKKLKKNYRIVREWFLPGTNEFVDQFLNSSSLRWNKSYLKKVTEYCNEKRKSGSKEDLIELLAFPEEGLNLRWKTKDIVRHLSTIKKYRKSFKCKKSQSIVAQVQVVTTEIEEEAPTEVPNLNRQRVRRPSLRVREQSG